MARKRTRLIALALAVMALAYAFTEIREFFRIDRCLDLGGRWNGETEFCEYEEQMIDY